MVDHSGIRRGLLIYYFIGGSTNLELRRPFYDEREFSFNNYIKDYSGIWEI